MLNNLLLIGRDFVVENMKFHSLLFPLIYDLGSSVGKQTIGFYAR